MVSILTLCCTHYYITFLFRFGMNSCVSSDFVTKHFKQICQQQPVIKSMVAFNLIQPDLKNAQSIKGLLPSLLLSSSRQQT